MSENQKSRSQSLLDFLKSLQLEYITAFIRSKIYPSVKDKSYYKYVMIGKREKIVDIAHRNSLKCIFTCSEMYQVYYDEVVGKKGLPNFIYRDAEDKENREYRDFKFYFLPNTDVRFEVDGEQALGKVVYRDFQTSIVKVGYGDGLVTTLNCSEVTRIL